MRASASTGITCGIIIGAAKAATSSLFYNCKGHPEIALAYPKETNFFTAEEEGRDYDRFWRESAGTSRVRMEASPAYTSSRSTSSIARNIHRFSPDARLIYIVRDPLDRLESHFNFGVKRLRWNHFGVVPIEATIRPSAYKFHLESFESHFRREAILVVAQDTLSTDPGLTMHRVAKHLGVNPDGFVSHPRFLAKAAPKRMWEHLVDRSRLFRYPKLLNALERLGISKLPVLGKPLPLRKLSPEEELGLAKEFCEDLNYIGQYYGIDSTNWRTRRILEGMDSVRD